MTERIPRDIYSYTSAGNTGRTVHPMCAAMAASSHNTQRDWYWEFERSFVDREFTCPKCGSHMFGTSHCLSPFPEWIGHCHGNEQWSCDFTWNRQTQDHEVMKTSPAAGESPVISPEVPQAHGLKTPATPSAAGEEWRHLEDGELIEAGDETDRSVDHWRDPVKWEPVHPADIGQPAPDPAYPAHRIFRRRVDSSAAVGASEPGAGPFFAHKRIEFLEDRIKQQGRQIAELIDQLDVKDDSISKLILENDRLTKLNHHLREAAVMAIVERVPSDSKPTNAYNPESEDTPQRGNDVTVTDKPFLLEYGKQYLRADGNVSDPLQRTAPKSQKGVTHPFRCPKYDVTYDEDGSHVAGEQCPCDLVAEYLEYQPAESPDDWVPLTDPEHTIRRVDECRQNCGEIWTPCARSVGATIDEWKNLEFRCRRKDLPVVPVVPDDTETDFGIIPATTADSPALPQFPEGAENNTVLWTQAAAWTTIFGWCRENGMPINRGLNGLQTVAQWILDLKAEAKPLHTNASPPDKPRMRQVTLREWEYPIGQSLQKYWGESFPLLQVECSQTGRMAVVEVPE